MRFFVLEIACSRTETESIDFEVIRLPNAQRSAA
jgi:hypothetical protein